MTTLEKRRANLARATAVAHTRAEEKRQLRGAPASVLVPALVNPTPTLATYTLAALFATAKGAVIVGVNAATLQRVCNNLSAENLRVWHSELRLSCLTLRERRRLVKELMRVVELGQRYRTAAA
jgi:hypothetical protein